METDKLRRYAVVLICILVGLLAPSKVKQVWEALSTQQAVVVAE